MTQMDAPYILEDTEDYAVVFKPPRMHTADKSLKFYREPHEPTRAKEEETLFNWYCKFAAETEYLQLLHRLDYETHGLVLFAKNEKSFNFFKDLQNKGDFVKEYSAVCSTSTDKPHSLNSSLLIPNSSFPPPPPLNSTPLPLREIESFFRPFGTGRKVVRPVIDDKKKHKEIAKDKGGFYKTEIISVNKNIFTVRIKRGFRHQIRCHLCWIGFPILNDPLYPEETETKDFLALRSHALFFIDPSCGRKKECRIESLS